MLLLCSERTLTSFPHSDTLTDSVITRAPSSFPLVLCAFLSFAKHLHTFPAPLRYPDGLVIPGSYVFLYGTGTTNLVSYVVAGEVNRVVVTQVDDCCRQNNLQSAVVRLNGKNVQVGTCQVCCVCAFV